MSPSDKPLCPIHQAYEDAHGVLNSFIPNPRYKDVIKALDRKCNEIVKLSALLKNYKAGKSNKSNDSVLLKVDVKGTFQAFKE